MSADPVGSIMRERLQTAATRFFWIGLAMEAVGIAAIIFPMATTIVATLYVGSVLLIAGALMLAGSVSIHGTGPFFAALIQSLFSVAAGVFLLFNPLAGAIGLTLFMVVVFSLQGAFEIALAFELRKLSGWTGMLISGLCSMAVAILIAGGWPQVSQIAVGLLLGVNFISTGIGYLFLANTVKQQESAAASAKA
jgi:uncharacterized membrane protein HdeD (DUF308 family)